MKKRRLALFAAIYGLFYSLLAKPRPAAPTDLTRLVEFATAYNLYIKALNRGQLALDLWSEVERRWARLR